MVTFEGIIKRIFVDFLFKFLVLGDSNTGKSCLLHNFVSGSGN
jgi:GTPase SAR1 family protein